MRYPITPTKDAPRPRHYLTRLWFEEFIDQGMPATFERWRNDSSATPELREAIEQLDYGSLYGWQQYLRRIAAVRHYAEFLRARKSQTGARRYGA